MTIVLNAIRILLTIISPLVVICLTILTMVRARRDEGQTPADAQKCLRCGISRLGGEGHFHYTENIGNARERSQNKQLSLANTPIIGSETHFVCDQCGRRYIRNENIQLILMALPYPLYNHIIIPLFADNRMFANFLIETLLIVLSLGALISAYDLFRAVRNGKTPLSEARDKVAIHQRKQALGKKFSFYTRMGMTHLKK